MTRFKLCWNLISKTVINTEQCKTTCFVQRGYSSMFKRTYGLVIHSSRFKRMHKYNILVFWIVAKLAFLCVCVCVRNWLSLKVVLNASKTTRDWVASTLVFFSFCYFKRFQNGRRSRVTIYRKKQLLLREQRGLCHSRSKLVKWTSWRILKRPQTYGATHGSTGPYGGKKSQILTEFLGTHSDKTKHQIT